MTIYNITHSILFLALISWTIPSNATIQCVDLFDNYGGPGASKKTNSFISHSPDIRKDAQILLELITRHHRDDIKDKNIYSLPSDLGYYYEGTRLAVHKKSILLPRSASPLQVKNAFTDLEIKMVLTDLSLYFPSISTKLNNIRLLENYNSTTSPSKSLIVTGQQEVLKSESPIRSASDSAQISLKVFYFFSGDFFLFVNTKNNKIVGLLPATEKNEAGSNSKNNQSIILKKVKATAETRVDESITGPVTIQRDTFDQLVENIHNVKLQMEVHALQRFTVIETLDPMNHKPLPSPKGMVFIDYVRRSFFKPILFSTTYSGSKELMQKLYANGVLKNTFSRYNYETFLEELRFAGYFAETIPFEGHNREIFEMDKNLDAILGILRDSEFSSLPIIGVDRKLIPLVPR